MTKDHLIGVLHQIEGSLRDLQKIIADYDGPQIKQQSIKDTVRKSARRWFDEAEKQLTFYGIQSVVVTKYHDLFDKLLQMGLRDTRKGGYTAILKQPRATFTNDIILPVYKFTPEITNFQHLDAILNSLSKEERPLMKEAIDCATSGYLRASVILGWAAAINRLHKVVENLGFDKFNEKSDQMNKVQDGRYKRATKTNSHVQNISELQATVFDNGLLWVLEYWGLIDYNQHERLTQCFVMRNTSAHPSSTKITPENVTSFYSDLKTIIFDNVKFKVEGKTKSETVQNG